MMTSFTDWDQDPNYLAHFGTKGMRWGQRRFQNPDGSLTAAGKARYGKGGDRSARGVSRDLNKLDREKTTSMYRRDKYAGKIAKKDARYAKKIAAAEASGKTKKVAKLKEQQGELANSRAAKKVKGYQDLINKNNSMTQKIVNSAKANGMKVSSKSTRRIVNKGAMAAKAILGAAVVGGGSYALGKNAIKNAPKTRLGNNVFSYDSATGRTVRGGWATDHYALNEQLRGIKRLGRAGSIATGAAVGASAKYRKGTKYKVQNKYRGR